MRWNESLYVKILTHSGEVNVKENLIMVALINAASCDTWKTHSLIMHLSLHINLDTVWTLACGIVGV